MKAQNWVKWIGFCMALLVIGEFGTFLSVLAVAAAPNPIIVENQNLGTTDWQINYDIGTVSDDVNGQIKGYASATSVNKGATIDFQVTVNPAQTYTIDVFRMGWYGGAGGRLMQHIGPLNGVKQPDCPMDAQTGLIQCQWAVASTLAVPSSWTTGIYLAKLTNAAHYQTYIVFVVRDDGRVADFVYQQPVLTYQAYNNYPADSVHGKSLYDFNSYGAVTGLGTKRAAKVSFDRPYGGGGGFDGGGHFAYDEWWERYFVSWAERTGYDISYTTDIDTQANGARLLSYKGFLSVGHNEYWSKQMYDAVEVARNAKVNLAFFGSDPVYWQIRFEPSSSGVANRIITCYKDSTLDPISDPTLKTIRWRDLNRAEQGLVGVQYTIDGSFSATQPYTIKNSANWVWSGTGFVDGSVVPGLLGYEVDKLFSTYPIPVNLSYTTLAESTYTNTNQNPPATDISQSSVYQAPNGAWVFAAGTMAWGWGLGRPDYVNTGIQQATKNIMDRFLVSNSTPTPTATPTRTLPAPTSTPTPTVAPNRSPTPTPQPVSGSVDVQIGQSEDDVEEAKTKGYVYLTSADLELGYDLWLTNDFQWVGLRFNNLSVPPGATITNAYVEFTTSAADWSWIADLTIQGHATNNAPRFGTARYSVSILPKTSALVKWSNIPRWITVGARQSTPNLKPIVQEIVNRAGWRSGNSMALLINGLAGRRAAYAYDASATRAPRLHIEWTMGRAASAQFPSEVVNASVASLSAPMLTLDYTSCAPGSQLTVIGEHFTPNSVVSLLLNQTLLTVLQTDDHGDFVDKIATNKTDVGQFQLSTDQHPEVTATYQLDQNLPLYLPTPETSEIPDTALAEGAIDLAQHQLYLPLVANQVGK